MSIQYTNWEFSTLVPKEEVPLSEGEHLLYIEDAMYNPDDFIYTIRFVSLTKEGEASALKFYMKSKNSLEYNNATVGTLNSLTKAIAGPEMKGVLAPPDVCKAIVKGTVKLSKPKEYSGELRQYPAIYEFKPVTKAELEMAQTCGFETGIQYTVG